MTPSKLDDKLDDKGDGEVPERKRGKGENMSLGERSTTMGLGVVGFSYFAVLLIMMGGIAVRFFV